MGQTGKRLRTDFQFSFTLFPISHSITLVLPKRYLYVNYMPHGIQMVTMATCFGVTF